MKNFINNYLKEIEETASLLNKDVIQKIIFFLKKTKKNKGRIFFFRCWWWIWKRNTCCK